MKLVYPIDEILEFSENYFGSKAWTMARLRQQGIRTPPGFCVPTWVYNAFILHNNLSPVLEKHFRRKHVQNMRWEELWDAAFQIRIAFGKAELPQEFIDELALLFHPWPNQEFAVRSSAIGEDSSHLSYAGLFSSILHCQSLDEILVAIKEVYASLWSQAAMMYRHELHLHIDNSAMALLIQPMTVEPISGILFSKDPRKADADLMMIESVQGATSQLVHQHLESDHYEILRDSCSLAEVKLNPNNSIHLSEKDWHFLFEQAITIEKILGYPVDIEWTGLHEHFTLLQARPITRLSEKTVDERQYFLTLILSAEQLRTLSKEVAEKIIPELITLGNHYQKMNLMELDDAALSKEIGDREENLNHWKGVYKYKLVPLAHAVRALGEMYQEVMDPQDPYEFIELLLHEDRLAQQRNQQLKDIAVIARLDPAFLSAWTARNPFDEAWPEIESKLQQSQTGLLILQHLQQMSALFFDVNFHTKRLSDHPEIVFSMILKLAQQPEKKAKSTQLKSNLSQQFLERCQPEQREKANEFLQLAQLSWRIRDDDDLLIGKLESQLLRAVQEGLNRLFQQKKLYEMPANSITLTNGVRNLLESTPEKPVKFILDLPEQPREKLYQSDAADNLLKGVPAAPGIIQGRIRKIGSLEDIHAFQPGEILACEFIDPVMTHLLMLASGVIESRGGMLVHSVIIARELGIPCVNGINNMLTNVENGTLVEVDGDQGLVRILV